MPAQSLPVLECQPVDEKSLTADKPPHRISVFKELDDVPPVWGRESLSGYKGQRILTPCSEGGKEYSVNGAAGGYEGLEAVDIGRQPMPADYGYEMPERYGGKGVAYDDGFAIPLAGNNNTWAPPSEPRRRVCRFGQRAFWITFGIVCILVVCGAVAAGIAATGISKSASTTQVILNRMDREVKLTIYTSGNTSSSSIIAISAALVPSTETSMTSRTSTVTLPNGSVSLTTEIVTSLQTMTPHSTSESQTPLSSSSTTSTAGSSSTTSPPITSDPVSSILPAATSSASSQQLSTSTVVPTLSTTTPTTTLSATFHSSSPQVLEI